MRNWPSWIPNPNAWLSAILLILLTKGISVVIRIIVRMGEFLSNFSPKWGILFWIIASLSPILLIAVAHHWLHRFLDHYFPNTQSPEMRGTQGFLPSLMSWWEGFYGWLAIALSSLIGNAILVIVTPQPNVLYNLLNFWIQKGNILTLPTLLQVIAAAYLYQFEYLVRQHLMSVGSAPQNTGARD